MWLENLQIRKEAKKWVNLARVPLNPVDGKGEKLGHGAPKSPLSGKRTSKSKKGLVSIHAFLYS